MKGRPKKGPPGAGANGKSALNTPHGHLPKAKICTLRDNKEPILKDTKIEDDDTDLNSGFGAYIRSPEDNTKRKRNMVGPFMQGMLLMGVIYWYSKGMLNMINEYYRTEFQKQLETNSPNQQAIEQDDIESLLTNANIGTATNISLENGDILENKFCVANQQLAICLNETELKRFLELTLSVCFCNNLNMLPAKVESSSKACPNNLDIVINT